MATLEKLPNLKILRLLGSAFVGKNMVCSERGFPQLQSLVLSRLESGGWRKEPCPVLPFAKKIATTCTIPDGLRFVTTLQELEIKDMPKTFKDRVDKGGRISRLLQRISRL
jgi:hypothetical protein